MLENIDISKFKPQSADIEQLKMRISTGKAILFTGAGFSIGTKNILHEAPPLASSLAKKLCALANIDESEDLRYASEVALEYHDHDKIIELLKDNYTLNAVSDYHKIICSLPWRRFYTTNYDNSIELASLDCCKRIESIDLSAPPSYFSKKQNVCLHLNGKVEGAIANDLDSKIKLTDSSYLSPDSFISSNWNYHFKKDLERSSAIIFIGYSMYDMDVKKILYENPEYQEKTYFIIKEGAVFQDFYMLRKFGKILPIGIENFSKEICKIKLQPKPDGFYTESLIKYQILDNDVELRDIDSEQLFLFGHYDTSKLQCSLREQSSIPYFIKREIIENCIRYISEKKSILIQGDLGNGKSILLEMLAYELSLKGYPTYILRETDGDYIQDLDEISKFESNATVIIDDYSSYSDILEHIKQTQPNNIQYVLADRNSHHLNNNGDLGIEFLEFNIDLMSDGEIKKAISIIDNLAAWQEFSSLSMERKFDLIKEKYNSQLSLLLLGLLNSPHIKDKIKAQTDIIYRNENYKKTVFSICICEISNVEPTSSLISEMAGNNEILGISLRSLEEFNSLFRLSGTKVNSKSSILALSLLNNTFGESYTKDTLLQIVERIDSMKFKEPELNNVFKSLLRFHIIERILPQRQSTIDRYYEQLKIKCPWLMESPHYWVQYAMSRLSYSDYHRAQNYLTNAYEKAKNRPSDYHTHNIDTQQARLYLNQSIESDKESFYLFEKGHKLLLPLPNDGRKFRQVLLYQQIFERKFKSYSNKNKVYFERAVNTMLEQAKSGDFDSRVIHQARQLKFISLAIRILDEILSGIKNKRLR